MSRLEALLCNAKHLLDGMGSGNENLAIDYTKSGDWFNLLCHFYDNDNEEGDSYE